MQKRVGMEEASIATFGVQSRLAPPISSWGFCFHVIPYPCLLSRDRIAQVLWLLVRLSIRYCKSGGQVHLIFSPVPTPTFSSRGAQLGCLHWAQPLLSIILGAVVNIETAKTGPVNEASK